MHTVDGEMNSHGDVTEIARRCQDLVSRRYFVDREPGALLMWLPTDEATRDELATLIPRAQARHAGVRFAVQRTGAALAVKATAREAELDQLYATYIAGQGVAGS
jgi:hypothetical protein